MNTKQILYTVVVVAVLLVIVWLLSMAADRAPAQNDTETPAAEMAPLEGNATYNVNQAETELRWEAKKSLIADYTDHGTLNVETGSVEVVEGEIVGGTVVFDMTSIVATETSNTKAGVDALTKHLASDDFFGSATFPTATLQLTSVVAADADNEYTVTGDLTMKGKTNEVTFPATIYMSEGNLVVDADITLDRTLWDVRFGSGSFFEDLGDNVIDDEFMVEVMLVAEPE